MQTLLNKVAIIPSYLYQIDRVSENTGQTDPSEITALFSSVVNILVGLENWEISLHHQSNGRCYWLRGLDSQTESETPQDNNIWYPNITMANVFTHIWAFRIVCLTELEKLALLFPWLILEGMSLAGQCHLHRVQQDTVSLSKQVFSSMEYLMQDEMKLYGPASTFFPLRAIYQRSKTGEQWQMENIARCQSIVGRLVEKGLRSAPIVVFGE